MSINLISKNEKDTHDLALLIAELAEPGDVYLLEGELGAGKTTFTKGLAKGLGISRVLKSPTYTLIREYQEGRLPLYHMDLYRLGEEEAEELGLEEYFDGEGITVVEWAFLFPEQLPDDYLKIEIKREGVDDTTRRFTLQPAGERYTERLKELEKRTKK